MIRLQPKLIIAAFVVVVSVLATPVFVHAAGAMGPSGGHDLDELWSRAQTQFDLTTEDAVLLLESRHVSIQANGELRTRVHRVVWIGANVAVRGYADLRIPYNSATSTLTVNELRTWRDNRWWPDSGVSETAVVETLPYAVGRADDYTTMRETMLLHDGVNLPCIMETDYEIVESAGASYGTDGLWVFPQDDPAIRVELELDVSQGESVVFHSGNGAPEPQITRGSGGTNTYLWAMENVGRMGTPHISDPAVAEPYVAWSTWRDWETLGGMITTSFNEAAVLNTEMTDTLAARLEHEPTPRSKARKTAELVDEFTRSIHYDSRFWAFSPRPASRTWETAYGHGLDRAVLAMALFRGAGFEALPIYRSNDLSAIDIDVPGLSRFQEVQVVIKGKKMHGCYDPERGTFTMGPSPLRGRTLWRPDKADPPQFSDPEPNNRIELALTVEPGEKDGWTGNGFVSAEGVFCPYNEMVGFDNEALGYIGRVASSVIDGASASEFNPEIFDPGRVTGGFSFDVETAEPDDQGRTAIVLNAPAGGIASRLPSDVHLFNEKRTSPVVLTGPMTQRVKIRIKTGGREIVQLPTTRELKNEVGHFTLRTKEKNGWVTIERDLTLKTSVVSPETWPELRALLLEEADDAGRSIFLK
jgi:hypothetical protein